MKVMIPALLSAAFITGCATTDPDRFADTDCEALTAMLAATPVNLPDLQDLRDREMGFESNSSFERNRDSVDTFDKATERDIEDMRAAYRQKGCKA